MALTHFTMGKEGLNKRTIRRILLLIIILGCSWGALHYICATWYVVKELNHGYYLTMWERNHYVIDYKASALSISSNPVLYEPVVFLEYSDSIILIQTNDGNNWVINCSITPSFSHDTTNHISHCSSLIGPLDSLSIIPYHELVKIGPSSVWSITDDTNTPAGQRCRCRYAPW